MALYQPKLTFEYTKDGSLIAHILVPVNEGEDLLLEINDTSPYFNITHLRYKRFINKDQDYPVEKMHIKIPWDGSKHIVEITIVDEGGKVLGHASNTSDDADSDM